MRIAINGFGRIGRAIFKIAFDSKIDIVAINDVHGVEDAGYLLKNDSVYGRYNKKVSFDKDHLIVDGKKIKVLSERDPEKLPWKELKIDVVIESTGVFRDYNGAEKHIKAGAKKVIITAPPKDEITKVIVPGVNNNILKKSDKIVSVASCTTNCLAPLAKIIDESFGIERAFMTTDHGYTSSQNLVDGSNKDRRRGRSAALNIVPTSTGANKAVEKAIPSLKGKLKGIAMRIPVATGSIVDLVCEIKKKADEKQINNALKKASQGKLKGIIEYSEEELVSSDIIGNTHSSIIDGLSTSVNGNLVKVLAWYDNEWGYSSRVVDVVKMLK